MFANRKTILAMLALFIAVFSASQERTAAVEIKPGEWMRAWLLCGPFPLQSVPNTTPGNEHLPGFETDFLRAHGGESNPRISAGQIEAFAGGAATWVKHTTTDFAVNLDKAVSESSFVLAYAWREFAWPRDETCVLALGTNDGGRAWLNGERIWDRPDDRRLKADDDLILVRLRKGRNTLLLKIEERGNNWGFCARILPFNTALLDQGHPLFRIVNRDDGAAALRFLHPASAVEHLFAELDLAVLRADGAENAVWRGRWTREQEMILPLNRPNLEDYGKYILRLTARVNGGRNERRQWSAQTPFAAGKRSDHLLFENGKTDYAIVVGEQASDSENWAAQELQHWLKEVSGAHFPIRSTAEASGDHIIVVGFNQRARELLGAAAREPADDDESFIYRNAGPSLLILGGKTRGTLYGVMGFLERELGCRWYTSRVSVAPRRARYSFDALQHAESPGVRVRNDFYYEAFEPTWAARNKMNGAMSHRAQPGGVESYWGVHTFYQFMPPTEFFGAHPEYYSLIAGKRTWERAQLCLTNPQVLSIVTERLKQTMRKHPEYLIYCVSQNDWLDPCQCDQCQAIAEREESESGPVIRFVNQVAAAIEKEFPGKFVGTLAYQYTRKPSKTERPRHNVVVRLCSIEACFAHDFLNCPENVSFVRDLQGWARIAPQLYIWDYVVNFSHYLLPYPNFRVLQPNIKTLRAHKAIGIMEQAAYQSRGGEFAELRAWVIAKLLWNPDSDLDEIINDFMSGYYGRSGQYVRRYFDLLHNRLNADTHIHLGLRPNDKLFSDEFIREAEALFDQAEAVADNEQVRARVELARLPLLYLKCQRSPVAARYDGSYDRLRAIVAREGITHYAENGAAQREAFHKKVEGAR